jgi:hypothetical protein
MNQTSVMRSRFVKREDPKGILAHRIAESRQVQLLETMFEAAG